MKLFIALSAIFLTACSSTEHCLGFPEHLIDYFPYKQSEVLKFVNQNNDTISFSVYKISKTEESTVTHHAFEKCVCEEPELTFNLNGKIHGNEQLYDCEMVLSIELFESRKDMFVWLSDNKWPSHRSCLTLLADPNKNPFNPIDSLLFGKTAIIDSLILDELGISKVVVTKGKGITDFIDCSTNYVWKNINY
jgi:hypothetical protein